MKLFSGRLDISNVTTISSNEWTLEGMFIDNSGMFSTDQTEINDIIFATSADQNTFELTTSRYRITSIDTSVTFGNTFKYNVIWDEANTSYCDPQMYMEAMVCRRSSKGISILSTILNGISQPFVDNSRSLDLITFFEKLEISVTSNIQEKIYDVDKVNFFPNNEIVLTETILPMSERLVYNGVELTRGDNRDYTIAENRLSIKFNSGIELLPSDIIKLVYEVG